MPFQHPTLLSRLVRDGRWTIEETTARFEHTARDMGEDATLSVRQLVRWMNGDIAGRPRPVSRRVAEKLWGLPFEVLLGPADVMAPSDHGHLPSKGGPPAIEGSTEVGDPTDRRRALKTLAGVVLGGTLLDNLWVEPNQMYAALDRGSVGLARLTGLRRAAEDLGVRVVKVPPATLITETLEGFRAVRMLIEEHQPLAARCELTICGAMFANILGEILFNEGDFALARHWYGVAERAATEAGSQYFADTAVAGRTYLAMYAPDPRAVLTSLMPRLNAPRSGDDNSPAIAWLWAFAAKAHAMLGNAVAFQRAIERSRHLLDRSSPDLVRPGIFSFLPEKLAFYEARGWVELGNAAEAASAAQRAINLYDPSETTEPALARFEHASALAHAGEHGEALRIATNALLDDRTFIGVTVAARAREFDQLLGSSATPEVKEWRENLHAIAGPPARRQATISGRVIEDGASQ